MNVLKIVRQHKLLGTSFEWTYPERLIPRTLSEVRSTMTVETNDKPSSYKQSLMLTISCRYLQISQRSNKIEDAVNIPHLLK